LIIVEAIRRARTEYVVYFLLSAWLETLVHTGRARALPMDAARLPVRDAGDISRRLRLIREELACDRDIAPQRLRVLEDTLCALAVAREKLDDLGPRAVYRREDRPGYRAPYIVWPAIRGGRSEEVGSAHRAEH
jgi:hypothetical protein